MLRLLRISLTFLACLAFVSLRPAGAVASEKRLALVVGNISYKAKPLATAANDAALIAQTLHAAGFDVTGARDLDEGLLRQAFRDFTDRITKAGPDAVALVYFAGYGVQFEGDNYLVPVDTEPTEASNLPARALRLSEITTALAALHSKTAFIILDAARAGPFILSGQAGGLAWVEPEANMLIAFNAAPGTFAHDGGDGYGPYARALAEMIREGDLTPASVFDRVRLRVHELTKGAQVPWDVSKIEGQFKFFERGSDAPVRADAPPRAARMRSQPMRVLGAHDAYMVTLLRDTFDAYSDFLAEYWQDPMTKRIRALLAARRESITWRRTFKANVPTAYWSYLERYPRGPHAADAGRLLSRLGAAVTPPSKFARLDYDVPPPLPDELEYIERPVLTLDDPAFAFEPPPPTPVYFLEPPPPEFVDLKSPSASSGAHALPVPTLPPLPVFVRLPADVVATLNPAVSDNTREKAVIPPAIDVAAEPQRQVSTSISSPQGFGSAGDLADSVLRPPSAAAEAIKSPATPPLVVNQLTTEESKLPMVTSSSSASAAPRWLTDVATPANQVVGPRTHTFDGETPSSAPTMLAPSTSSSTIQSWSYGLMSSPTTVKTPQQTSLSAPPAQPGANLPQPASTPPSQTTGSIPSSITLGNASEASNPQPFKADRQRNLNAIADKY